jgi:8-oxo-dGTP pyrophosphatase MutT (NUDIX family)
VHVHEKFHAHFFTDNPPAMKPWKTKSRRTVYSQRPWLDVELHEVELPDGRVIPDWTWVVTPAFVNVVAITDDDTFICFRQVKYAIDGVTLATVGGYCEPGEDPRLAAERELMEETGHTARQFTHLGSFPVDGNRGSGIAHLWLAIGAHKVAAINADDLEEQEMLFMTRDEVKTALLAGEFKGLSWSAAVAMALLR